MSEQRIKIQKKEGEPTEFEYHVSQRLGEIVVSVNEFKNELKDLIITGAIEYDAKYRGSALQVIIIMLHYRSMSSVRKVHRKLTLELEKRFSRPVALVFQRTILPKYLKTKGQQKRPYSRTLTKVHEAILEDLVYPVSILGRRIRIKTDGKRVFKVLLDPSQRDDIETKLPAISAVYRKLTNKDVVFEFPQSREFPV